MPYASPPYLPFGSLCHMPKVFSYSRCTANVCMVLLLVLTVEMECKMDVLMLFMLMDVLMYLSLQAAVVAHRLFCMCYKFNMRVQDASTLLLLAEIHKVQQYITILACLREDFFVLVWGGL